jgi:hypothetical protein
MEARLKPTPETLNQLRETLMSSPTFKGAEYLFSKVFRNWETMSLRLNFGKMLFCSPHDAIFTLLYILQNH